MSDPPGPPTPADLSAPTAARADLSAPTAARADLSAPTAARADLSVDIGALSTEERDGLDLLLCTEHVAHELGGAVLTVAATAGELVAELVEIARWAPRTRGPGEGDPLIGDPGTSHDAH
jgi:hypothetical protein